MLPLEDAPTTRNRCPKGTWNERMRVETRFSLMTVICDLKRLRPRTDQYISTCLACVAALFNALLTLFHRLHPDAAPGQMSTAEFSL